MKTAVRNVIGDLVEKRLWPVALALVIGIVAVPVVLTRGGAPTSAPVADDAAVPGAAETPVVRIVDSGAAVRDRAGAVRNPFGTAAPADAPASTPAASTPGTATDGAGATSGSTRSGSTGAGSAGSTQASGGSSDTGSSNTGAKSTGTTTTGGAKTTTKTSTPAKTTAPTAEDPTDTYHVSVRFGVDGGTLKTIRDIARLSPLPSVTDPFFVYLGVLKVSTAKTKRAVFIVSSAATPNGEGACHPTKQDCETVELTVGQTAYFDATAPNGKVTQYELQLAGIHKTTVKSEAKAFAAFARHSVAGAELLRDAATRKVRAPAGARAYRYLPGAGLLVRAKRRHVTARAAAAGTLVPGLALVARKDQPGIPVWHSPAT